MTVDPRGISGRILIGGELRGTAWRVGRDRALTAAHCLLRDDDAFGISYHDTCTIEFPDGPVEATRHDHDTTLDVAVLDLKQRSATWIELATLPWDDRRVTGETKLLWHGYGYPDAKSNGLELTGAISSASERAGQGIQLTCQEGGYGNLKHASGSAIIHGDRAIAVLIWHPPALAGKVIYARTADQIVARFPFLRAPMHQHFRIGATMDRRHLKCDRDLQWGKFHSCITAQSPASVFFVTGPEHEAPEVFVERIEHASTSGFLFRRIKWSYNLPPTTVADYVSALSQAIAEEELPSHKLLEAICEFASEAKLVLCHPLLDVSSELVRDRLESLATYYTRTVPELFTPHALPRQFGGVVLLQPLYWKARGLGRLIPKFARASAWQLQRLQIQPSSLHAIDAPDLTRITDDHVRAFLSAEAPHMGAAERKLLLREARRCRTSREVLKVLKENID